MEKVKFSICIPTYNRAYVLGRCLDSLLKQTFKDFEVLVVDDGSTDNTSEIIKSYGDKLDIKYNKKENGGKHTALNVGITQASGEFFIILDSDDMLVETALEDMNKIWETNIPDSDKFLFCGIMGKCKSNDKILGSEFESEGMISSYVDFHFKHGSKTHYGDCCECIRTDVIKQYTFPEPAGCKFVPEFYIFDQIGCDYNLYCTNSVFKIVEYMQDGITKNADTFYSDNAVGMFCGAVARINIVFKKRKDIGLKQRIGVWLEYWTFREYLKDDIDTFEKAKISPTGIVSIVYYRLFRIFKR